MRLTGPHCCLHAESFYLVVWLASLGIFLLIFFGGEVKGQRAEVRGWEDEWDRGA